MMMYAIKYLEPVHMQMVMTSAQISVRAWAAKEVLKSARLQMLGSIGFSGRAPREGSGSGRELPSASVCLREGEMTTS